VSERPPVDPPALAREREETEGLPFPRLPENVEEFTALGRGSMARVEERFRRVSLNVPLRVELPEVFEVKDLCEGMQEVLDRITEEDPEAPQFERASAVDGQLEQHTAQFTLRNIPRVERMVEDRLEFERTATERLAVDGLLDEVRNARHEAPDMLEPWSVKEIVAARETSAMWMKEKDWTRYFGREVLRDVKGPRWRYDPDSEPGSAEAGEAASERGSEARAGQEEAE
jgi:hypothetical protein